MSAPAKSAIELPVLNNQDAVRDRTELCGLEVAAT